MKLAQHLVEKPWGRCALPSPFDSVAAGPTDEARRIGEIWLQPDDDTYLPVLVKYMFTSEKLSVQVHPDDAQAQARGWPSGKNECWYITEAQPGAMLGLGMRKTLSAAQLRTAALDGSIETLLDWRPIRAGEFYVVPAGTIHAMSAGISLIEFQQNIDLTYRLYDYGRPRELHLDDGVAVARAEPYSDALIKTIIADGADLQMLAHFPQFEVFFSKDVPAAVREYKGRAMWIVPLSGVVTGKDDCAGQGDCFYLPADENLASASPDATALIGVAVL